MGGTKPRKGYDNVGSMVSAGSIAIGRRGLDLVWTRCTGLPRCPVEDPPGQQALAFAMLPPLSKALWVRFKKVDKLARKLATSGTLEQTRSGLMWQTTCAWHTEVGTLCDKAHLRVRPTEPTTVLLRWYLMEDRA